MQYIIILLMYIYIHYLEIFCSQLFGLFYDDALVGK